MGATKANEFQMTVRVHSPRWGHADTYTIAFSADGIEFSNSTGKSASCTFPDGSDPEWSGYGKGTGNPIINIFENDHIYVSDVIVVALESAWERWDGGDVSDDQLKAGIEELFAWVDQTAQSKPASEFWTGVF